MSAIYVCMCYSLYVLFSDVRTDNSEGPQRDTREIGLFVGDVLCRILMFLNMSFLEFWNMLFGENEIK